jgi:hypothetical protein
VLTSRPAEARWAARSAAPIGAAFFLSIVTFTSAHAGSAADLSCIGAAKSFNCAGQWAPAAGDPFIRVVPDAVNDAERARMSERDRKWSTRCRPAIERDQYGVARYRYAAPGCEFGVGAD